MLGHLDPAFHAVLDEVVAMLRAVWRMPDGDVLALPSTGTSAMEAGLVNLLDPGDTAIVAEAGFFGKRLGDMAERRGANVVRVTAPWGETVPNAALLDALDRHPEARLIAVVHAETSTGALHPLRELATGLFGCDVLLMADCVTSLGGIPLDAGAWGIDYAYSCTQKCLAAPPGMAPVAISPRAWRRIAARRAPVPFALDLELLRRYWVDRPAVYHHTTPILGVYALHEALRLVLEEGLEARWARHAAAARAPADRAARPRARAARRPGAPDGAADRRARPRGGRRQGGPDAAPRRARDRGRRRARAGGAAHVADRADGPQRDDGGGDARPRRARRGARARAGARRRVSATAGADAACGPRLA